MYVEPNYKNKKALKDALTAGTDVTVYSTSIFGENVPDNGTVYIEGPHYPAPHTWYAQGTMKDGKLVKVK